MLPWGNRLHAHAEIECWRHEYARGVLKKKLVEPTPCRLHEAVVVPDSKLFRHSALGGASVHAGTPWRGRGRGLSNVQEGLNLLTRRQRGLMDAAGKRVREFVGVI